MRAKYERFQKNIVSTVTTVSAFYDAVVFGFCHCFFEKLKLSSIFFFKKLELLYILFVLKNLKAVISKHVDVEKHDKNGYKTQRLTS